MNDDEPKEASADDSEQQAEEQPTDSEQPAEQSEEQPADSDQPAEQAEEQPAESDQPAEQSEEQPAESDQQTEQSDEQPAEQSEEQPASVSGVGLALSGHPLKGAGKIGLLLDGKPSAALRAVQFGDVHTELDSSDVDEIGASRRSADRRLPASIEMQTVGAGGARLLSALAAFCAGDVQRLNGSVVIGGGGQIDFKVALFIELKLTEFNAGSKEPGFLTVALAPEDAKYTEDSGVEVQEPSAQGAFLRSSFRLEIGDLDCSKVTRIDSLSIERKVKAVDSGGGRPTLAPTGMKYGDLFIELPSANAKPFEDWLQKSVGAGVEKSGTLAVMSASGSNKLFLLRFSGINIYSTSQQKGDDDNSITKVKMSFEKIEIVPQTSPG
jgi:DNA mismatch repair ATPase MutL